MADLTTLARPYAKAAFGYAAGKGSLAKWSTMLGLLSAVTRQETLQILLSSPSLTSVQQAQSVIDICGDELDADGQNFVRILAENKRLALLPEILQLFEALKAEAEKSVDVEITSALAIDSTLEQQLAQALKNKLNCDVRVNTTIDQNLIGGVVIRAGDTVIDSSIRGRLTKLAESINS
ncbi:MAG TPA: F0F1 ATP synthase subunit delta [Pseudomonadales bacterium]